MIYNILAKILKALATGVIKRQKPKVIGVTGSVGKTSTKEAIYWVLREKFHNEVARSYKNLNTGVGLPLAILRIDKSPYKWQWIYIIMLALWQFIKYRFLSRNYPKILILEYAADKPRDITYLLEIVKVDVGCITEIGPTHLEEFKTIEAVIKEKMQLVQNMKADGIAVLNEDNKYIKSYAKNVHYEIIWFHGSNINGAKNAAQKIGEIFNINQKMITDALDNLKEIKGRLNVFKGIKNTILIDDTYNASPLSMTLALKYLKHFKNKNRKVAILGDMRELGEVSAVEHQKLGILIVKNAQDAILIGPQVSEFTAEVLKKKNFPFLAFSNFTKAKRAISENIKNNDVILIKASQNTLFLERVTEMLLSDKNDLKKLCRQSPYWLKIKQKTP